VAVAAMTKTAAAAAAAMAIATTIAMTDVQLLVRARSFKDVGL
jgi:hypothetical protein